MLTPPARTLFEKYSAAAINPQYHAPETDTVKGLLAQLTFSETQEAQIRARAEQLITQARALKQSLGGVDAIMMEYDLSCQEGIVLMCLAEALLRIPDRRTADKLIQDKLSQGNFKAHLGHSHAWLVNASTWGLVLTGHLIHPDRIDANLLIRAFQGFVRRTSQPIARTALKRAMKFLGNQFVMGETIELALKRAQGPEAQGYRHSYDMLGEAALTENDALYYFAEYQQAIKAVGLVAKGTVYTNPGISVKLSALHPRYKIFHIESVFELLYPRLLTLCQMASHHQINLTVDAEESDRLELSLMLLKKLCQEPSLKAWHGLGLAVQAYQKRAFDVIGYLQDLAHQYQRRWMLRLVKGAYWDSEIKWAQVAGYDNYPVFTRKPYTDVSYLTCAQKLLSDPTAFYPQFATHNAWTLSAILELSKTTHPDFEFQCLHGMGDVLYQQLIGQPGFIQSCRVYAPVGSHKHLLAYLVRRLLENGANSSFVNQLTDPDFSIEALLASPLSKALAMNAQPHPQIPLPPFIYGATRMNAKTFNISNSQILDQLAEKLSQFPTQNWQVKPLGAFTQDPHVLGDTIDIKNPANGMLLGKAYQTRNEPDVINQVFHLAQQGFDAWRKQPASHRAALLRQAAAGLENHFEELIQIAILEAGKTLSNAIAEVREAVDFCRYYAEQAEKLFGTPIALPGPTGEKNQLIMEGRGPIVCISPWNFPLAIFLGQVTAALAAGNAVLAKPAEQTPYIAYRAVQILHEAGIPQDVLQLVTGSGRVIGMSLIAHPNVAGVIFTGSTQVAKTLQTTLAEKSGPIVPLIAETGGQNAMIVDSSALPEQVTQDVITSSFDSAGQRCSALRVLYLQEEIADTVIAMLKGSMKTLKVGDPWQVATDVGPVIDYRAKANLMAHIEELETFGTCIAQANAPQTGEFVPPTAFEIDSITRLKQEHFGPILHVIRFKAKNLDHVIDEINGTGYGLTFGIHSRIQSTIDHIVSRIKAGNIYINRNTVGAIVGVQPFGGEGLSGTGPKAGGPHYLLRLVTERTLSTDTTASGGNASLMTLGE